MSENAENKTPFSQQIAYINKGTLDAELTETLAMIIQAVRETRKKGSVTLTLNCEMLNSRTEDTIKVTPDVKFNKPKLELADTIMFSTADGDLLRDDPDQIQIDLQVINTKSNAAPIKLQSNS
ncbi:MULTISPECIES: hypothetical protein [Brenneria]|uniref:Uncharacterized protein n=1 Tax=Brenneria nigrifluens DSM 30175 = ATCC 13028 TaxID=1121120 RepID=A0A2U1UII5_9GAMM|nr:MULTISPECIES: hypothetical protein [Brenneria]EHD21284.1 hypothetical protein BrE312_1893 [Brenneria sp. EniD312]PWC21486.1 hypothetical protein DDT54_18815 [Brenneria nigrifluens DSM 30175 = ATCC 13028]QCR04421.1 hypothetical protein EH206_09695 [Brenneria nigrifluens DSM 30175 = ATCC 13028]